MRLLLLLPPVLALAGCATGPGLETRMVAYTGASGETLVQNLGVPDKQIRLNGVQYMAYVQSRTEVDPSPPIFIGFGGFGYGNFDGPLWGQGGGIYDAGLPSSVMVWRCETTFRLQEDKVVGVTLRGNDCS